MTTVVIGIQWSGDRALTQKFPTLQQALMWCLQDETTRVLYDVSTWGKTHTWSKLGTHMLTNTDPLTPEDNIKAMFVVRHAKRIEMDNPVLTEPAL